MVIDTHNYRLLPRYIGLILSKTALNRLNLVINRGTWDYEHWAYPIESTVSSGGYLSATFEPQGSEEEGDDIGHRWKLLTNTLAGVFCASLDNSVETTFDTWTPIPGEYQRVALLPRENICTENLTPWLKQLPCQSKVSSSVQSYTDRSYEGWLEQSVKPIQNS